METTGTVTPDFKDGSRSLGWSVDQASMGAHDAIGRISDAALPMVDHIASSAHQAVDRIGSAAGEAAEALGVSGEQLKNVQARAMEQARGYVRDNPVAALGIAIAAGYLLSRLLGSR